MKSNTSEKQKNRPSLTEL